MMGIMEMMMAIKDMQGVWRVLACFFNIQGLQALHISCGIVHYLHQALFWAFRLLRKGLLFILTCVWIFKKQFFSYCWLSLSPNKCDGPLGFKNFLTLITLDLNNDYLLQCFIKGAGWNKMESYYSTVTVYFVKVLDSVR